MVVNGLTRQLSLAVAVMVVGTISMGGLPSSMCTQIRVMSARMARRLKGAKHGM